MRRRSRLALVGLTALLALAFALPAATAAASGTGKIRAFHDSPDTPAVDIWVNGAPALTNVVYGTVSQYLRVPKGAYLVEVKVAPSTAHDPAALSRTVTVGSSPVTVAAIGSLTGDGGPLQLKVLRDRKGVGGNWALVRVAHTSPDAPAVDIQVRFGKRWIRVVEDLVVRREVGVPAAPREEPVQPARPSSGTSASSPPARTRSSSSSTTSSCPEPRAHGVGDRAS